MSATIHKSVGYGFTNIENSLLNQNGFIQKPHGYSIENFRKFLATRNINDVIPESNIEDCIIYQHGKLCVTPPEHLFHWHRQGDAIDWAEESSRDPYAEELPHGIPGFRNLRDVRHERPNGAMLSLFYDIYDQFRQERCEVVKMQLEYKMLDIAQALNFNSIEEVLDSSKTCVPESVIRFCEYVELFTSMTTVAAMKPIFIAVWR